MQEASQNPRIHESMLYDEFFQGIEISQPPKCWDECSSQGTSYANQGPDQFCAHESSLMSRISDLPIENFSQESRLHHLAHNFPSNGHPDDGLRLKLQELETDSLGRTPRFLTCTM
ncbi:hypothetical protein SAY87_010760 [Trapa incisa]|uniref:Uncharacterized protein n=1 Tax=Trapa incisa TaxID=236973 RepID=A0AAN7GHK1_9MYRT|nr:hypothetical protein SAY87_010760 [Trapa incisa]